MKILHARLLFKKRASKKVKPLMWKSRNFSELVLPKPQLHLNLISKTLPLSKILYLQAIIISQYVEKNQFNYILFGGFFWSEDGILVFKKRHNRVSHNYNRSIFNIILGFTISNSTQYNIIFLITRFLLIKQDTQMILRKIIIFKIEQDTFLFPD